jgi:hypothetical protein
MEIAIPAEKRKLRVMRTHPRGMEVSITMGMANQMAMVNAMFRKVAVALTPVIVYLNFL